MRKKISFIVLVSLTLGFLAVVLHLNDFNKKSYIPTTLNVLASANNNIVSLHFNKKIQPHKITNAPPVVDFSFDNNNTCSGTTINFSPNVSGDGPFEYSWSFGDGIVSNQTNPSHIYTSLGCSLEDFNVTLTVTDVNTLSSSVTKTISVQQKPLLEFEDIDNAADPFYNCESNTFDPSYTINVGIRNASLGCINSFEVDWGDGTPVESNVIFPATHTYTQLGFFEMQITGIGNTCDNSVIYSVNNSNNPTGSIISPGNTVNLCTPISPIEFGIGTWGNNPPDTTYLVDYSDGTTARYTQADLEASIYYDPADPANSDVFPIPHEYTESTCPDGYTVFLFIATSCGQTNLTAGPIIILKKPEVSFESPEVGCANANVRFNNTSINGFGNNCRVNDVYYWDFGDGNTSTLRDPSHTYTASGTYTVSLYAENSCGTTETITKTICIEPEPLAGFTLDAINGCTPFTIQTTNTTTGVTGCLGETYLWEVTYESDFCGTEPELWRFTDDTNETSVAPAITFTTPGSYTLTLTTTNFCGSNSRSEVIEVKQPPTVSIAEINNFCGSATINPSAMVNSCAPASEVLNYEWTFTGGSPSSASTLNPGTISYTSPGNYSVSLSVTSSCGFVTDTIDFNINPIPNITNTNLSQTICSGTNTDEINLTADITGTTFSWTGSTTATGVTGFLTSGNTDSIPIQTLFNSNTTPEDVIFTVVPTLNGCEGSPVEVTVTVNPSPVFTSQPLSESVCLNGEIATLSVSANGDGTVTYQWYSNTTNDTSTGTPIIGETNATYTPPSTAVGVTYYYCVLIFDSDVGCNEIISDTARIEIVNDAQIVTNPIAMQSLCVGGSITDPLFAIYTGGSGIVTYQWYTNTVNSNTGGTAISNTNNPSYMPPVFNISGSYYYYVEISLTGSGCSALTSEVAEIIVTEAPVVDLQPLVSQEICQNTTPVDLEVAASGGLPSGYNYQWYSNSTNSNMGGTLITGETNNTFTPPTNIVGTLYYYCEITQSHASCSVTSDTSELKINAAPTFTSQPISQGICIGDIFNTLSVDYNNGVGVPSYQWYSNTVNDTTTGTLISGATSQNYTPPSTTIGTRYYYAIITFMSGGCTEITSNISEQIVYDIPRISDKSLTTCSGGEFNIIPDNLAGDTVPLGTTYTWNNPIITPAGSVTGASNETTGSNSINQTLINNTVNPATVTYTVTPTSAICTGLDFNIVVTVNPSISVSETVINSTCYGSNSGSIEISITGGIPFLTGDAYDILWVGPDEYINTNEDIFGLEPGDYTLTIRDDGNCPFTETFTIAEPDELVFSNINFDPETISCFSANDGQIGIDIAGGTMPYTYNWNLNGTFFSTTEDLSNLGPGDYEITVTDANNCPSITTNFEIIEPDALQINLINQVDVVCFGDNTGVIDIEVSGGRPIEVSAGVFDYGYSWTGPNGFTSNTQNLTNLFAGTYNLTVTDRFGCTDTLEVTLNQANEILIAYTATEGSCFGDNSASITIDNISGGNPPYTIAWSNLGSGTTQTNLSSGIYTITVTDETNCQAEATIVINDAPLFRIVPNVSQISCFGADDASIKLNLEGGNEPITLIWEDDPSAGIERNNLMPGVYTVRIRDGVDCIINETFNIIEPELLFLSTNITDALDCNAANSGAINLIVTGGTAPFTYSWSNGATTEDLSNIPSGAYNVEVIDANGCEVFGDWVVNRFEPISVNVVTNTQVDCDNRIVNQTFEARPIGGVPPYNISWSSSIVSGDNNEFMNTTQDGLVIVDITDNVGCTTNYSFNVEIPELGFPNFSQNSMSFATYGYYSKQDPIEFINTSNGNYISISWDFGDGNFSSEENPLHTYVNEGRYIVIQTVTYPFGCIYTRTINLIIEKGYSLAVPNAFTPNGDGINDYFTPESLALNSITFSVYNTWGGLIYSETGDDIKGWDGKIKGTLGENGNYYFTLTAKTFYGDNITKEGVLSLIK